MRLFDAHNHLHDARLMPHRTPILQALAGLGVVRAVVNGTREADWDAVASLAKEHTFVLSSFGLHPWHVAERTPHWLEALREKLETHPAAGVGEIGLDRWIEGHDLALQSEVFLAQLALAVELQRPVTIHCLRAWGALDELLPTHPAPSSGFLIHAYGGPAEMIDSFAERGGYFSFNAYFLHERKAKQRDVFREIPADRLLVETDTPDLRPPDERNLHPLRDANGEPINHPANIALAYEALADIRGVPVETLAAQVEKNFARLFGPANC
jgi:TatD DNase family protein